MLKNCFDRDNKETQFEIVDFEQETSAATKKKPSKTLKRAEFQRKSAIASTGTKKRKTKFFSDLDFAPLKTCERCNVNFTHVKSFLRHLSVIHSDSNGIYKCHEHGCLYEGKGSNHAYYHIKWHKDPGASIKTNV